MAIAALRVQSVGAPVSTGAAIRIVLPWVEVGLLRACREWPSCSRAAKQRDERAALHVWMAPAWQEEMQRAAQKSLAVMCPACSRSPEGLLALMESANRGLIIRAGSMSR